MRKYIAIVFEKELHQVIVAFNHQHIFYFNIKVPFKFFTV